MAEMTVPRIFLDASVLFAAVYSAQGYARDLIRMAIRGQIQPVVSQHVLDEVLRNITRKAPDKENTYQELLELIEIEIVSDPDSASVEKAEAYVVQKDAPVVAAAIKAQVNYLVTFDRKHLINPEIVAQKSGLHIVTPEEVVKTLQQNN